MTHTSSTPGLSPAGGGPETVLTDLQVRVLQYAATEHTDQRIADALDISIHTVREHWRAIRNRLRTADRAHSVAVAVAAGVVTVTAPAVRRPAGQIAKQEPLLLAAEAVERRLSPEEGWVLQEGIERLHRARVGSRAEHAALEKARGELKEIREVLAAVRQEASKAAGFLTGLSAQVHSSTSVRC